MNYLIKNVPIIFFLLLSACLFYLYYQERNKKQRLEESFNDLQNSFLANRRITYELAILKEVVQNFASQPDLDSLVDNLFKSLNNILPIPLSSFLLLTDLRGNNRLYSSVDLEEEQKQNLENECLPLQQEVAFYHTNSNLPSTLKSLNLVRGISLPLTRQEKVFGTLVLAVRQSYQFSQEDLRLFTTITQQTALVIENLLLFEQQLAQSRQLASLGEVAAGIAHEIKNPLAIIRGFAECLPLDLDSPEEIIHSSQLILQEVDRLNKIISDVLNFARPHQPELLPADLNTALQETLELMEGEIKKKGVQLETHFTPNMPPILLDREQIRQVFLNLIINSLEAMPQEGVLKIESFSENPEQVVVIFRDNGAGIPAENLDNIFRPFFSSKKKGTGLGLAITSRIIENHHAKIQVESTPGQGSSFYLYFQAAKTKSAD